MNAQQVLHAYQAVRAHSIALCTDLSAEDMVVQSMPDASPTKWHLAHTTWFFETFVSQRYLSKFNFFSPHFQYLFNSYYESEGERHARPARGLLTRPSLAEVMAYREHVDAQILRVLDSEKAENAELLSLIEIGLHHEMQHQELMQTDIKHVLFQNRFNHVLSTKASSTDTDLTPISYQTFEGGLVNVGHSVGDGNEATFSYDCERPAHQTWLAPFSLAQRPVCNADWLAFIQDKAYDNPLLWLSDGWHTVQKQQWHAPLYWQEVDGIWYQFDGQMQRMLNPAAPVCHISYYEADAFARWAGKRLPTEFEWEHVAQQHPIEGQFATSNLTLPQADQVQSNSVRMLYGSVWEWTQSAYLPYPGFRSEQGALGEYNGKFMVSQHVLRGGSCATPKAQLRPSYRNFFYPHHRWQFSGLRLADSLS